MHPRIGLLFPKTTHFSQLCVIYCESIQAFNKPDNCLHKTGYCKRKYFFYASLGIHIRLKALICTLVTLLMNFTLNNDVHKDMADSEPDFSSKRCDKQPSKCETGQQKLV